MKPVPGGYQTPGWRTNWPVLLLASEFFFNKGDEAVERLGSTKGNAVDKETGRAGNTRLGGLVHVSLHCRLIFIAAEAGIELLGI